MDGSENRQEYMEYILNIYIYILYFLWFSYKCIMFDICLIYGFMILFVLCFETKKIFKMLVLVAGWPDESADGVATCHQSDGACPTNP